MSTAPSEIPMQSLPHAVHFTPEAGTAAKSKVNHQRALRRGSKFEGNHRNIRRSHKSSDYILSVLSLSQWIQTYGARSDKDLEDEVETFIDTHGVRRFKHNWKEVPELQQLDPKDPLFRKVHHNLTGCIQHSIHCVSEPSIDVESGLGSTVIRASFLNDWQRLWYFLEDDEDDELAQQTPLFRLAIEFVFHRRTYQIYTVLLAYNTINDAILYHFYPYAGTEVYTTLYVFDAIVRFFTYIFLYRLFRGEYPKLFNHKHNRNARDREIKREVDPLASNPSNRQKQSKGSFYRLHWTSAFRQLLDRSFREMFIAYDDIHSNLVAYEDPVLMRQQGIRQSLNYYDLLNISLKFFTRHNGTNVSEIRWNRTAYRLMILFVVFIYPLYFFLHSVLIPYSTYVVHACSTDYHGNFCQYYLLRAISTFGTFTTCYTMLIFGGSVLISLVGLAYGGEIANRLADTWMEKFCCLRRLSATDEDDDCYILKSVEDEEEEIFGNSEGEEVAVGGDSTTISALHQRVSSKKQQGTAASTKLDMSSANTSSSSKKYRLESNLTEEEKAASRIVIGNLIARDATEHYLFIREMMQAADRIWSPALTVLFALAAYISIAYFLYMLLILKQTNKLLFAQLLMIIIVRLIFLFFYPIVSISHANSYIYKLQNCFKVASPDDYEILGGRDRWISFMTDTPAVWTYYGIWITWDRLFGILWTTVVATAAYIFTLLSSAAN